MNQFIHISPNDALKKIVLYCIMQCNACNYPNVCFSGVVRSSPRPHHRSPLAPTVARLSLLPPLTSSHRRSHLVFTVASFSHQCIRESSSPIYLRWSPAHGVISWDRAHQLTEWALTHWLAAGRQDFVDLLQNDSPWSLRQYGQSPM